MGDTKKIGSKQHASAKEFSGIVGAELRVVMNLFLTGHPPFEIHILGNMAFAFSPGLRQTTPVKEESGLLRLSCFTLLVSPDI